MSPMPIPDTPKYRRPTRRTPSTSGNYILDHDAFLFHELPDEFSYQHNSRGVFQFIEGTYDLPETMDHPHRVHTLAMFLTILDCAQKVAWIEHTGNWDIFMVVTMADGTNWFCYDDMKIPGFDHDKNLLFEEWPEDNPPYPTVEVTAATVEDYDKDDFDYDTGMVTRTLAIDDIREIHLWFDT